MVCISNTNEVDIDIEEITSQLFKFLFSFGLTLFKMSLSRKDESSLGKR